MRVKTVLKFFLWVFLALILLMALAIGALVFMPQGWLTHLAGEKGSAALGRPVSLDSYHITWNHGTPYVQLNGLKLGNTPGAEDPDMVSIDAINFHIRLLNLLEGQTNLPDLELVKPRIVLEKNPDGSKNWEFPALSGANVAVHAAVPSTRSSFPILGDLKMENGTLIYRDDTKKLNIELGIETATGAGAGGKEAFKLSGHGKLQGQIFNLDAQGGSLDMLRNGKEDYPLNLHLEMGATKVSVNGTFQDPVAMKNLYVRLDLSGDNLADLFYLTQLPLPPSPPYKLGGDLSKSGDEWTFKDFKGQLGHSDLNGTLLYDGSKDRAYAKADLTSHVLDMKDLGGLVGAAPGKDKKTKGDGKILPDVPLNLDRLRTSDMDVELKAGRVEQAGLPLQDMDLGFHLKQGVLRIDPLNFGVADGKVEGSLVLEGSKDVPGATIDLSLIKLSLKPFFKDSRFAAFSAGHFGGQFKLAGNGHSLAEVLGNSDGHVTLAMSGGTVSQLMIDAAGLDFGRATPALLGSDKSTQLRCAIGDFGVKSGLLNSDIFVVDTGISNINGTAKINLKDESIDAQIEANPKQPTLAAGTPIDVEGTLGKPTVGLDPAEISGRAGAAAALSILNPLAALIPFIELGLGKDSDCEELIQSAQKNGAAPLAPAKARAH